MYQKTEHAKVIKTQYGNNEVVEVKGKQHDSGLAIVKGGFEYKSGNWVIDKYGHESYSIVTPQGYTLLKHIKTLKDSKVYVETWANVTNWFQLPDPQDMTNNKEFFSNLKEDMRKAIEHVEF